MRLSIVHRLLTPHPPNPTARAKRRRQLAQGRLPQAPPPRGAHCSLTASARRSSRPGQARAPSTIALGIELVYTTLRYASRDGRRNPANIQCAAQTPSSGSPNCATTCPKKNLPRRLANRKDGETDASAKRPLLAARCPLCVACTKMGAPRVVAQGDGHATAHRAVNAHRITHGA